jgi:hypothetical protein
MLCSPQGITACRFPDLPEDIQLRSMAYDPTRGVVDIYVEPSWSPHEFVQDPEEARRLGDAGRLRLYWLHDTQECPEQYLRTEQVRLTNETSDDALLCLLQDSIVGRDLRDLAARIIALTEETSNE